MLTYFRCPTCLATTTVDTNEAASFYQPECGICGGTLERLGEVHQSTWVETGIRCVCDDRCTNAQGPNCECSCGGVNHGIGSKGDIEYVRATGKVKVTPKDAATIAKHLAQSEEFKAAYAAAQARYEAKLGKTAELRRNGTWLPRSEWDALTNAQKALRDAKKSKVQKLRIKKCAAICAEKAA